MKQNNRHPMDGMYWIFAFVDLTHPYPINWNEIIVLHPYIKKLIWLSKMLLTNFENESKFNEVIEIKCEF